MNRLFAAAALFGVLGLTACGERTEPAPEAAMPAAPEAIAAVPPPAPVGGASAPVMAPTGNMAPALDPNAPAGPSPTPGAKVPEMAPTGEMAPAYKTAPATQ